MEDPQDSLLQEGIEAVRAGNRARARSLLTRVVDGDERNLPAWYWLSRVAETPEERTICLENVLALDPAHMAVRAELSNLRQQVAKAGSPSLRPKDGAAATGHRPAAEGLIADAAGEPLLCPYCGGLTAPSDRRCPHCRHDLYGREPKSKGHTAYSLGLVLLWVLSANLIWIGLMLSFFLSGVASVQDASPGMGRTLETLSGLLGIEGAGLAIPEPPLIPIVLVGGGLFLFSLLVAGGLYKRLSFFYWLTVGVILLGFLFLVWVTVSVEDPPVWGLAAASACLLLTIAFAFMAYDEFAWESHRLDASMDRDVDGPSALFSRGRAYAGHGMWAKAATHWSRAVALNPGQPDYRLALATAYLNLSLPDRAREHLNAVRQVEPDNARVRELLETLAS